ncbi:MAG: geranylgeranylglyceryl/heptaprenylglyceryl phosphate synthase [bacterium]
MGRTYQSVLEVAGSRGSGYVVLLDPDKAPADDLGRQAELASRHADFIFVGGSLCVRHDFDPAVKAVKAASGVPVVIFPGDSTQVSAHADALLFLSLVSGRNADLLIGEHVKAAPIIKRQGLEVIPVAYMLVESGRMTSVQFMSQSLAIPRTKPEIAMAHALAGEYLGMKLVYMDAGSGAQDHVPVEIIEAVSKYVSIPVVVGGGIRTPRQAEAVAKAGASLVVTGDVIEQTGSAALLKELADAVHRLPSRSAGPERS